MNELSKTLPKVNEVSTKLTKKEKIVNTLKLLKYKKYTTSSEKEEGINIINHLLTTESPLSKFINKEINKDHDLKGIFSNKKSHGIPNRKLGNRMDFNLFI